VTDSSTDFESTSQKPTNHFELPDVTNSSTDFESTSQKPTNLFELTDVTDSSTDFESIDSQESMTELTDNIVTNPKPTEDFETTDFQESTTKQLTDIEPDNIELTNAKPTDNSEPTSTDRPSDLIGPIALLLAENKTNAVKSCHKKESYDILDKLIPRQTSENKRMNKFFERWIKLTDDYSFIEDDQGWPEPTMERKRAITTYTIVIVLSVLVVVLSGGAIFFGFYQYQRHRQGDPEAPEEPSQPQPEDYHYRDFYHDDDVRPIPTPPPPSPLPGISSIMELVNLVREMAGLQDALETEANSNTEGFELRPLGLFVPETPEEIDADQDEDEVPTEEDKEDVDDDEDVAEGEPEMTVVEVHTTEEQVENETKDLEAAAATNLETEDLEAATTSAANDETKDLGTVKPAKFKTAKTLFLRRLYE